MIDSNVQRSGTYEPDLVFPPGDTLRELLDERGMTQAELAERMGRPKKTLNEIAQGKAQITSETALELETVLGVPAAVWTNLQSAYDRFKARQEQLERFEAEAAFLKELPVKEMTRLGWLPATKDKAEMVRAVFEFFAVNSVKAWRETYAEPIAAFRVSNKSKTGARAAWLRKAELQFVEAATDCPPYQPEGFKEALGEVRGLTCEKDIAEAFEKTQELCRAAGVVVDLVRELPGAGVSGATLWRHATTVRIKKSRTGKVLSRELVKRNRPAIFLTLRYKTDDQFWFSFFHKAGHVLKHKQQLFLEVGAKTELEKEADAFAADHLIPRPAFKQLRSMGTYSAASVKNFAENIGVCPGIVVGRLHHEGLVPFSHLNGLKRRLQWVEQ